MLGMNAQKLDLKPMLAYCLPHQRTREQRKLTSFKNNSPNDAPVLSSRQRKHNSSKKVSKDGSWKSLRTSHSWSNISKRGSVYVGWLWYLQNIIIRTYTEILCGVKNSDLRIRAGSCGWRKSSSRNGAEVVHPSKKGTPCRESIPYPKWKVDGFILISCRGFPYAPGDSGARCLFLDNAIRISKIELQKNSTPLSEKKKPKINHLFVRAAKN